MGRHHSPLSNVTQLRPDSLEARTKEILLKAKSIAIITVDENRRPSFISEAIEGGLPDLICAVRSCLYDLEDRYEVDE